MLGAIVVAPEMGQLTAGQLQEVAGAAEPHIDRLVVCSDAPSGPWELRPLEHATALAAIADALGLAGDEHALILAADLRNPSSELIRYLIHVRGSHEAIVPIAPDGRPQPLLALYHGRCARRAAGLVAAGERRPEALLELLSVRSVTSEEVAKFGDPGRLLARTGDHSFM